jgi:hypothetical protein
MSMVESDQAVCRGRKMRFEDYRRELAEGRNSSCLEVVDRRGKIQAIGKLPKLQERRL